MVGSLRIPDSVTGQSVSIFWRVPSELGPVDSCFMSNLVQILRITGSVLQPSLRPSMGAMRARLFHSESALEWFSECSSSVLRPDGEGMITNVEIVDRINFDCHFDGRYEILWIKLVDREISAGLHRVRICAARASYSGKVSKGEMVSAPRV